MGHRIIPRAEWGFTGWLRGIAPHTIDPTERDEFFVHYNGGKTSGRTGVAVPRDIHRGHLANGWAGIGYGFVIDQAGNIYEGRGFGYVGAHCPDHNRRGHSAQIFLGGDEKPTAAALEAMVWLYNEACKVSGRTLAKRGHRDGVATACPGEPLYAWVKAGMPAPAAAAPSKPTSPPASGTYTVRAGDTLGAIATRHKVSVADLARWNGIKDPDHIEVGQKLKLTGTAAAAAKPTPKPAPKPSATPSMPWLITSQKGVYLDQLKRGVSGSTSVYLYQLALRRYIGSSANKYNPSGATGGFFSETEAMTRAVYASLYAKAKKAGSADGGGWGQGDTRYPGTGLLGVLGVKILGAKA